MSKRYIDAEALIKKLFPYGMPDNGNYGINAKAVRKAIDEAPTEDVFEVNRDHDDFCGVMCEFAENIINEQKADVEELEKMVQELIAEHERLQEEIERLNKELAISQTGYVSMEGKAWELREQLKTAKAEAYKEFWKELYVELRMYGQQEKITKTVFLSAADKVLKELEGDSNG